MELTFEKHMRPLITGIPELYDGYFKSYMRFQ